MAAASEHPARILISSQRKPVTYLNPCKRCLQEHGEVHLSALGIAISSAVTVAEILKSRGIAAVSKLSTSLETLPPTEELNKPRQKPKIEVLLIKGPKFDEVMASEQAAAAKQEAARQEAAKRDAEPAAALAAAADEAAASKE